MALCHAGRLAARPGERRLLLPPRGAHLCRRPLS
jgi:hypothetical protein